MTVATAQNGLNVGNLLLDAKAAKFRRPPGRRSRDLRVSWCEHDVFNADRSQSAIIGYALTSQGGTETINNTDQSLVFQIGANVGQTASIGIRSIGSSSLGKNLPATCSRRSPRST